MLPQRPRRPGTTSTTQNVTERALFFRSFLAHPRRVGAVLPTSRRAVRDMLDLTDVTRARCVVEFGAGTGVYTEEVLARLASDARLVAFEVDPSLADALRARLQDPRLQVVTDSAAGVEEYLQGDRADIIVSGLPFTSLPADVRHNVLERSRHVLAPTGVMLVLQYSPAIRRELNRIFTSVRWRLSLLNVPPAFLFACAAARQQDGQEAR